MSPSVGASMTDRIKHGIAASAAASGGTASPEPATPYVPEVEDDEFFEDGIAGASGTGSLRLPTVGSSARPNGILYKTRLVEGVEDIAFLRAMRERKRNVLFYGPPGTGKTALSEAAFFADALLLDSDEARALMARAETLGVRVAPANETYLHLGFESIVCGADTMETDFYGTFVPNLVTGSHEFWAGPLLRAVLFDVPIYADEVFLCDSRVLSSTLYPLMDGRGVLRITMNPMLPAFPVGQGFFVVAAGNPNAPGAVYSEALRSRFAHQIEIGTDWVLARELGVPQEIITIAKNLDKQRREGSLSMSPQLRELLDYRDDLKDLGKTFAVNALLGKTPFEDREVVQAALKAKFATATPLAMGGRSGA